MLTAGLTDIGKVRSQNQDSIFVSQEKTGPLPNLFIVADGMGGHNAGDVASQLAISSFCEYVQENTSELPAEGYLDFLITAAAEANRTVYRKAMGDFSLRGMGTTFTACTSSGGKCWVAHVGDSRAYLISGGAISQLTADHTYVNEMVKAGQLTPSQAREHPKRNILTQVLGVDAEMKADGYVCDVNAGSLVLLCSDGLTNMLGDDEIREICSESKPVGEKAKALIDSANARGGSDNISAVLIDFSN
jgi:protein phosphatase